MSLFYIKELILLVIIVLASKLCTSQNFITGADLSYTNTILDKGGEYRDAEGDIVDPYEYFAFRGAKMVRLRLWHTPENIQDFCGNSIYSSNLEDVLLAAQRIHDNGMEINLSIHYGDYFNDPGKQLRPNAWMGLTHQVLLDSIYNYTHSVLEKLYEQNTTPAIVSIGNETTNGFIDETVPANGFTWPEDADKFNAGLDAVDDFNTDYAQSVLKAVHVTESTAQWVVSEFINHGISNFDIIGISYYPYFSPNTTLDDIGELFLALKNSYDKPVMLFETGFIWTNEYADDYNNFISNNGNVLDFPTSPEGQKVFLMALSQVIMENGGIGVIYWEPAWVTSGMCDKWGQGSSYENASFFDFTNQNTALPVFDFFQIGDTLSAPDSHTFLQMNVSPNPFNSRVVISYFLKESSKVTLIIYDHLGNQVITVSRNQQNGNQQMVWDANEFANGFYFFQLHYRNKISSGKLLKAN